MLIKEGSDEMNMMKIKTGTLVKSFLSRMLFLVHGFVSVFLIYANTHKSIYWTLFLPLGFLILEMGYTLLVRKGVEFKYFWPSGLFYILTLLPIIWTIELELLSDRISESGNRQSTDGQSSGKNAKFVSNEVFGKQLCEVGIIIGLISGRWLMPRSSLTRDQLSALLLGYVGNAADILELFETFDEPNITHQKIVTLAVISVYSWSILQFTLVTTATIKDKKLLVEEKTVKSHPVIDLQIPQDLTTKDAYILKVKTGKTTEDSHHKKGRGRKQTNINRIQPTNVINAESSIDDMWDEKIRRRQLHGEVFQILVTLFMQDGPFLILRLYLIVKFNVLSEMHIFFTCKNAIVVILLVYRLCILTCREKDGDTDLFYEDPAMKLHNVQIAILDTHMQFEKRGTIRVN